MRVFKSVNVPVSAAAFQWFIRNSTEGLSGSSPTGLSLFLRKCFLLFPSFFLIPFSMSVLFCQLTSIAMTDRASELRALKCANHSSH